MNEQELLSEIQFISDSLFQLQQDVDQIKPEVIDSQFAELLDKLNRLIKNTEENLVKVQNEMEIQKKEFMQLKEQINHTDTNNQANHSPSEFRQLQNMLKSSNNIEPKSIQPPNALTRKNGKNNTTIRNKK